MKKIAIAITGASGSIYAKLLLQKLEQLKDQVTELSLVMTDNAKQVWQTELNDENMMH
jgi:flavin prenyltransferase